jgi:hypothetical protein
LSGQYAEHFGYFINAIALEESLPFTDVSFPNECGETVYDWNDLPEGMHIGDVQNRSYQPPRNESVYIDDPSDLKLLYVVLTHDNANATIRLVEELYEADLHQFVIMWILLRMALYSLGAPYGRLRLDLQCMLIRKVLTHLFQSRECRDVAAAQGSHYD